jgi:hypothetical protein
MMMQTMMQVAMLVQAMMEVMNDGGVCDIISPSSNKFHKEWLDVCSSIACESPSLFPWHLISF